MTAEDELLSNHATPQARFATEENPSQTARATSAAMEQVDLSELIGAGDAPKSGGTGLDFGSATPAVPSAAERARAEPATPKNTPATPATPAATAQRGRFARFFGWLFGRR